MERLGDYIEQIRGVSYKPEDLGEEKNSKYIPLLRANNIQNGVLNYDDVVYVSRDKVNPKQIIREGDIVLCASSGSKDLVGKAAAALCDFDATFGAFCKLVRSKKINHSYLNHYFQSPFYRRTISAASCGVNINNIRNENIDELYIPLPPLDIQKKIAATLDKASELINLRRRQIEKLDLLVKSRFVEMFGNVEKDAVELRDICTIITDGTHQPPKFHDEGIPFLFVSNIVNNEIGYKTDKYISREDYEVLIKRTPVEVGDILLTTVGSYGNPAIVRSKQEFCFQRHIAYMKPKREKIDSVYLHAALQSDAVKKQIETKVKGIAQKTLNLSELKTIRVILPPLDLQNCFAVFAEAADKSKFEMQRGLTRLELNYKSLMQGYFG